ncbi:hypothetical protein [Phyllobacterium calauticae]|jgi:hypothetical protein|uniref:hypothetical protein n=1 Tax=Phyllobacterium calauticae TaxID=2817027 RepID=UPI001CBF550B|nr:hypothetical protein [Phyllobacterium calauticae]MBZ3695081.1 hypothetical protein [Phyllobacterium calauticae]
MNEPVLKHEDEIDQIIADHGGDFRAAIDSILKDNAFLIKEIECAALVAGHGYARGWKPRTFRH